MTKKLGHIPKMIIISGPSGSGKTTIYKKILEKYQNDFTVSISCTTRQPRNGEESGVDYFFFSKNDFLEKTKEAFFLEWAEVHGNFYGTPKDFVFNKLSEKKSVLFDIDWQGALQIKENCQDFKKTCGDFKKKEFEIILIFILPPSLSELRQRLLNRGLDSDQIIEKRIEGARTEIEKFIEYDFVIFNENIEKTFEIVNQIIHSDQEKLNSEIEPYSVKNLDLQNKIREIFLF
jgi:guanylate kinase